MKTKTSSKPTDEELAHEKKTLDEAVGAIDLMQNYAEDEKKFWFSILLAIILSIGINILTTLVYDLWIKQWSPLCQGILAALILIVVTGSVVKLISIIRSASHVSNAAEEWKKGMQQTYAPGSQHPFAKAWRERYRKNSKK